MNPRYQKFFAIAEILFLLACLIGSYMLMTQYVPQFDDIRYHYFVNEIYHPISNFYDIFISQAFAYLDHNGRFLCHGLVQFFCSFGGLQAFFISSALVFAALVWLVVELSRRDSAPNVFDLPLCCLLLMILHPQSGIVFFGSVAFTVNYLWSAMIYAAFIALYYKLSDNESSKHKWFVYVCVGLFGIFCGSWQESFSIGIAGSLFIYHLINIKNTNGLKFWLVVGFGIGAAIGIFAPSNFIRADAESSTMSLHYVFQLLKDHRWFQLLVFITIASLIVDVKKKQKLFITEHWLFYGSIIITFVFCIFIAYHDIYQLTSVIVFTIVLLLLFLKRYIMPYFKPLVDWALSVVLVIGIVTVYVDAQKLRSIAKVGYEQALATFIDSGGCQIINTQLELLKLKIKNKSLAGRMLNSVVSETFLVAPERLMNFYSNKQLKCSTPLTLPEPPETIVNHCDIKNEILDNTFLYDELQYIILKTDVEMHDEVCLVATMHSVSKIEKLKDRLLNRKEVVNLINSSTLPYFKLDDHYYYIYFISVLKGHEVTFSKPNNN